MPERPRYGPPRHARRTVRDPDAYNRPTDGKIKAPTAVGRKWLVGLGIFRFGLECLPAPQPEIRRISMLREPSPRFSLEPKA